MRPPSQEIGRAAAAAGRSGEQRVVVCNADEGEPGTFKDRVLLRRHFDAVLEGMTVGAFVLGARQGFVYLRGEYRWMLEALEAVLAARRAAGLLGLRIAGQAGFDFDVAIHLGAGAYVCGEESALIESLEGKRGNPRIRPPFPVEQQYVSEINGVQLTSYLDWMRSCSWITRPRLIRSRLVSRIQDASTSRTPRGRRNDRSSISRRSP